MPLTFYDKKGQKFDFAGSQEQFNKWNTFGFTTTPLQTSPPPAATTQINTSNSTAVQNISTQFEALKNRIATEGITDSSGVYLQAPAGKTLEEVNNTTDLSSGATSGPTTPSPAAQTIQDTYNQSLLAQLEKQRTALESSYKTQLEATQKSLDEAQKKYDEALANQKSAIDMADPTKESTYLQEQQIRQNQLNAAQTASNDLKKNYEAKQKLVTELDSLLTNINSQILAEKAQTGLSSIREPRVAQSIDQANSRIGVINASLAAYDGQYSLASKMIDDAANAMSADRKDRLNYYNALQQFYGGQADTENAKVTQLTSDKKAWISAQISLLENDLATTQQNVENIKKAMMDPDTAQAYANAGVTLNDTPAMINKKLSDRAYLDKIEDDSNDLSSKGYSYSADGSVPAGYESQTRTYTDSSGKVITKTWIKKTKVNEPNVFGSTESGYHYWDPVSGTFKTAIAGTGGDDKDKNEKLIGLLAEVPSYKDRESALKDLETMKTVVILQVGQDGYNTVKAEIDRVFPEKVVTTTPSTPANKTLYSAGKKTGGVIKDFFNAFTEPFKEVGSDIGSFFGGLFGG